MIKLGGSLLDLPRLTERVGGVVDSLGQCRPLLLIGGGRGADAVRQFDKLHGLDEAAGHWLAVRAMQLNTHAVAAIWPRSRLVSSPAECDEPWSAGRIAVIEPLSWLEREHEAGITIPHRWSFTSDSIAAHIARQVAADHLTLLKSAAADGPIDLQQAAERGLVDSDFPQTARDLSCVHLVNLRADPAASATLS